MLMKVVKRIIFLLVFISFASCNGTDSGNQGVIIIDESLTMGENAEIINEGLADRELGIMYFPGVGKLALLTDVLIADLIDEPGLEALIGKYKANKIIDALIQLFPARILSEDGLETGPSTEQIIEFNSQESFTGFFRSFADQNKINLPITVNNEATAAFLNLMAKIRIEDSKKIRDFRPAVYAIEYEEGGFGKELATPEWADCACLQRDPENPNELDFRWGVTWHNEKRFAPIYNPFLGINEGGICTYNDGINSDSSFILQGQNVLISTFSTFYDARESFITGPEGNMHVWAFATKYIPLKLPSNLDNAIPQGGSDLILKGPSKKCEWEDPNPEQYIAYQNFILWPWERSDPPEKTAVLIWEGDECLNLRLFKICNPDDLVAWFILDRNATLSQEGLLIRDIDNNQIGLSIFDLDDSRGMDLQVKTIDFCRNRDFLPIIRETCNGYDDTCDGFIDEGFPIGDPCDNGQVGQCRAAGAFICNSPQIQETGGDAVICNTPPRQASPFEICDNIDNDCDGDTDEDWIQKGLACGLGVGTCGVGALGCADGHISCDGEIFPESEICDGLDNDCDGVTDEGCPCVSGDSRDCSIDLGPCSKGTQNCVAGTWSDICSGVVPAPEICDNTDNNCNGAIDEGVLNRCGDCGPEPEEICDGFDNDCDGGIDEDIVDCCNGQIKQPEQCDGIDNDCDDIIDERENPLTCGVGFCQSTSVSVCNECEPIPPLAGSEDFDTTCNNGIDDDCDGLTDVEDIQDCWQIQGGGG